MTFSVDGNIFGWGLYFDLVTNILEEMDFLTLHQTLLKL